MSWGVEVIKDPEPTTWSNHVKPPAWQVVSSTSSWCANHPLQIHESLICHNHGWPSNASPKRRPLSRKTWNAFYIQFIDVHLLFTLPSTPLAHTKATNCFKSTESVPYWACFLFLRRCRKARQRYRLRRKHKSLSWHRWAWWYLGIWTCRIPEKNLP